MNYTQLVPAVMGAFALFACSTSNTRVKKAPDAGQAQDAAAAEDSNYQSSSQPNLQWKRYAALEADIARALKLEPEELCVEFGSASCIREVHLVPLGGHDPFETGLLSPSREPLATTPAAVDRVLLSACTKRVLADKKAGEDKAKVFDRFDLSGDAPDADSSAVHDTVRSLYRRFLGRNPDAHEVPLVASLAVNDKEEPRSASDFAILSCYTVGTTTEFLFF